jgi:hypothetical protein
MSLWEYKVISSGKGGFATPALLEKFLNDLGREEWEIVEFRTAPDNPLAFSGLARRSTQRDWTLQDAAAAAAKAEAEKLRAEFEAKFKAATSSASENAAAIERTPSFLEEKAAPDDGFRKPIDTSHDDEPETAEDKEEDEWDKLTAAEEDELPTFFEAIKPHMRRNQRGPGMSVGVDYLAKKWDQNEEDLIGALKECGFEVPDDEDATPVYLEYDGDLYWLNVNRRGELWINTKEKPRQVFRPVKAQRIEVEAPAPKEKEEKAAPETKADGETKAENGERKPENGEAAEASNEGASAEPKTQNSRPQNGGNAPLPQGAELLATIRPPMRRNRRGPGGSGSASFLARALRTNEAELRSAFAALGLTLPAGPNDKPVYSEIGNEVWWLNVDSRGGVWINGRDKKPGETLAPKGEAPAAATPTEAAAEAAPVPAEGQAPAAEATSNGAAASETPAAETAPTAPATEAAPAASALSPETPAPPSPVSEPAASPAAEPVLPPVAPAPTEQPAMPAAAVETPAPAAPAAAPAENPALAPTPEAAPAAETSAPAETPAPAPAAPAETAGDTANPISGAAEGEEEKKPRRTRSRKKAE